MDIKESKFFTKGDLGLLGAMGYNGLAVQKYGGGEAIGLGDGVWLLAKIAPCGLPHYWVMDWECNDHYLSERDVLGAMFHYRHGGMVKRNDHGDPRCVPDFFRPWEVSSLHCSFSVNRELLKGNEAFKDCKRLPVYAESWRKYYVEGKCFALVTDGKKLKIATDPFQGEYPDPSSLPEYAEWETASGRDGKPLEISLGRDIFGESGLPGDERARALNIKVKKLDDRGIAV